MEPRGDGIPLWRVSSHCKNLIRELTRYRWKTYESKKIAAERNPYDEPNKKDDHGPDSLRYFIMSRPELGNEYGARTKVQELLDDFDDEWGVHVGPGRTPDIAMPLGKAIDSNGDYVLTGPKSTEWAYDEFMGGDW
jgi:hypothetical protein